MMKQIFRKNVPNELLFNLLEKICLKTEKYYLFDQNAFRKLVYNHLDKDFLNVIIEYYHTSKQFYISRKLTYNSFTTLLRQICKSNNIMFTSQLKYNESKYNIDYFIYLREPTVPL